MQDFTQPQRGHLKIRHFPIVDAWDGEIFGDLNMTMKVVLGYGVLEKDLWMPGVSPHSTCFPFCTRALENRDNLSTGLPRI